MAPAGEAAPEVPNVNNQIFPPDSAMSDHALQSEI
jgi:hypothetical protein